MRDVHRIMRLIIFFDLPVNTTMDKKNYRKFKKFLLENGYLMLQYSVYARILLNYSSLGLQREKLQQNLPPKGQIRMLLVTEKQFAKMEDFGKPQMTPSELSTTDRIIEL